MAYGSDATVFVEDNTGDLGGPPTGGKPWWLSPDIDIPAHSGQAVQGSNDVQIRVHTHEEPIIDDKVTAEVYVGNPSLVMSPSMNTKRIDPGNLVFRPPNVAGTEPVANDAGATLSFPWTPSSSGSNVDGPGHRCLVVRAFPLSVTPPSSPFDVPNEQHEAQHNIEILTTTTTKSLMSSGGAGIPGDPRKIDKDTGLWWEKLDTMAATRRGTHHIVVAFDPEPSEVIVDIVRQAQKGQRFRGFAKDGPAEISLEAVKARGERVSPAQLVKDRAFATAAGVGRGLFGRKRMLAALSLQLGPRTVSGVLLRFDHSNIQKRTALVMHVVQWNDQGRPEGGMTVVALAPTDP